MKILQNLSVLALRQVLDGAANVCGVGAAEGALDRVVLFLTDRFVDHSRRLPRALEEASDRAWKTLEIALAGESLLSFLDRSENRAFRAQVRAFLDNSPLEGVTSPDYRQRCLRELRAARKAGLLAGGSFDPHRLARGVGDLARYAEPQKLTAAEWQLLDGAAGELERAGYSSLAQLVGLRPPQGQPLLLVAVRYYFRRTVETDQELYQGMAWAQLEGLQQQQQAGFEGLNEALATHGQRIEDLFADVVGEIRETRDAVLDVQAEQHRQGQQMQEIYQAVLELKRRYDLKPTGEVRVGDSLSISHDGERRAVQALVGRFRGMSVEQRRQAPALLNSLAQLEVGAGDFEAAQQDFQEVATLTADPQARAAAHHNAYWAALERRQWTEALAALRQAVVLDPGRYEPFPFAKYNPERILGAGGFGVAFLCCHRNFASRVVIKTLRLEGLDRTVSEVFTEARVLEGLDHRAMIRVRDCDYAGPDGDRPYLVMDYFDGLTLEDHIEQHGPLAPDDLLSVAGPIIMGLQAAHAQGVLHRDIKPANLLVRKDGAGWQVKIIDFGLALKKSTVQGTTAGPAAHTRTLVGDSIAGTLNYGAPEQLGLLTGAAIGPHTDVYAFGKTCCYALFKTTNPLPRHWRGLPADLAELLELCLNENPVERLADFVQVQQRLERLTTGGRPALVTATATPDLARSLVLEPVASPGSTSFPNLEIDSSPSIGTVGSRVLANGLGDGFWYPGTVRERTGNRYLIQFDAGSQSWVEAGHVAFQEVGVGDRVMANWKSYGTWYGGKILEKQGDRVHVHYDDNDKEWTTLSLVRVDRGGTAGVAGTPTATVQPVPVLPSDPSPPPSQGGSRVLADGLGDGFWYPGTVRERSGNRYLIQFDAGGQSWVEGGRVVQQEVRVGDRVMANWKSYGTWYRGKVTEKQGDRVHIHYDDNDKEWTTLSLVRIDRDGKADSAATAAAVAPLPPATTPVGPKPDVRVWDRILGRWMGGATEYPGRIALKEGDGIHIQYDDGGLEWTTVHLVRREPDSYGRVAPRPPAQWRIGDRVLACWLGELIWWYAATIQQRDGHSLYVKYDDGDEGWVTDELVTTLNFQVGDKVYARTKENHLYYLATILKIKKNDVQVQFDKGAKAWTFIRYLRVTPYALPESVKHK